jgi:hypothetical protein
MVCTLGFEVKVYALEIGVGTFDLWLEHVFALLAWGFRVWAQLIRNHKSTIRDIY